MAVLKVLRNYAGWRVGDHVEAFGDRLNELLGEGVVEIVTPDASQNDEPKVNVIGKTVKEEVVQVEQIEIKKQGRPKKI